MVFVSLNSNIARNAIVNTDLNTYTVSSTSQILHYYGTNISSMTNKPSDETNAFPFALDVLSNGGYVMQTLSVYTPNGEPKVYARQQYYNNGNKPFGNWDLFALNKNVPKRTLISATSTNFTEVYEFPSGLAILCARLTIEVAVINTSGSIYYGTVAARDWGYTFAEKPTVTVTTRPGNINGWAWESAEATTTQTPAMFVGRGVSATGTIVFEFQAIGRKAV